MVFKFYNETFLKTYEDLYMVIIFIHDPENNIMTPMGISPLG